MNDTVVVERTSASVQEEAKAINNLLQITIREYKEMLTKLEAENKEYDKFQAELKKIGMSRGFSEELWEQGVTVKDRWSVEEKLFGKSKVPTPTDPKVMEYCNNSLKVLDKYSMVFSSVANGKTLFPVDAKLLEERKEIKQQLDTALPLTSKPLSIVGGNTIAQQIDNFARAHLTKLNAKTGA